MTVNGARVTKADHKADNGVIHIVSDVIYPFPTGNIAEAVTADPRFSTLLAAVGAAGKYIYIYISICNKKQINISKNNQK